MTRLSSSEPGKPRILFIAPLPPPVHGSAVVSQQIRDSACIRETFRCDFVNLSSSRTVSEIGHLRLVKLFRMTGAWFRTLFLLTTRRYERCYIALTCHGNGFLKDAPFALLCKLFRRPLLIHQHNKGMSKDLCSERRKRLLHRVYDGEDVILLSERLYPDIAPIVPKDRIRICPNGIADCPPQTMKPHSPAPGILFLANLIPSKGVYELLDACALLERNGVRFHCTIAGNETTQISRKALLERIEALGLSDSVHYTGPLYGEDKAKALGQADVFAFPTYFANECLPLCILEAMRASLPVVTTDEGGIADLVADGDNGLLCQKQDAQSLFACLSRMLTDPQERERMGRRSRERFLAAFTQEHFEKRMIEILSS